MTVHGKTYSNDFPFLSRIPFTTVCKPFEKKFASVQTTWLPIHSKHQPVRTTWSPVRSKHQLVRTTCSPIRSKHQLIQMTWSPVRSKHQLRSNDLTTCSLETATCWIKCTCNNYSGIGCIFSFTFLHQLSGITFFVS